MVNEDSWQVEWNIIGVENSRDTMRSVFNEAQRVDDTLRQVGGGGLLYRSLLHSHLYPFASVGCPRRSTRARRTEPFHLISRLNFRSDEMRALPRIIVFLRTRELHRSTETCFDFPSFYALRVTNVSARCIRFLYIASLRDVSPTADLYPFHDPITVIHKFTTRKRLVFER